MLERGGGRGTSRGIAFLQGEEEGEAAVIEGKRRCSGTGGTGGGGYLGIMTLRVLLILRRG